jgi:hypothetical protein
MSKAFLLLRSFLSLLLLFKNRLLQLSVGSNVMGASLSKWCSGFCYIFYSFSASKKIGNCNNSRCREYIIVNRLRFALRLICQKFSQPIETLQRRSLAQYLTWFNANQEKSEYFMTLSSIVQLSHELTSNGHIIARPSAGFPAIIMVPPISSNQLCNMHHLHRLVSHFVVGRLSAVGVAKTNI